LYTLPGSGTAGQAPAAAANVPPPTGYQITAADSLNIRRGPGTSFAVVGKMLFEAQADVLGRDASSVWWQIDYQGVVGWVSARYGRIQPDANINRIPVSG
ncbi:MAG: SH3 domain-containing protein, partial [Anaerolineae bacterium]|nr:SH3 domain-containing protein [Anaerolineae bacterium]